MSEPNIHFINLRIIKLMREQNKSLKELMNVIEVISVNKIIDRLKSSRTFDYDDLKDIAEFLGVPFFDLVGETWDEPRSPASKLIGQVPENFNKDLEDLLNSSGITRDKYNRG